MSHLNALVTRSLNGVVRLDASSGKRQQLMLMITLTQSAVHRRNEPFHLVNLRHTEQLNSCTEFAVIHSWHASLAVSYAARYQKYPERPQRQLSKVKVTNNPGPSKVWKAMLCEDDQLVSVLVSDNASEITIFLASAPSLIRTVCPNRPRHRCRSVISWT